MKRARPGWAALLLGLLAPAVAPAQTTDIPPPVRFVTDGNGVDLTRGEHLINVTDVSIGPTGQGALAYTRQLRRTGGGNPYDLGLFQSGSAWTASVGLTSFTFTQSGSTFTSTDGSGATLAQSGATRTLTLPDGTIVTYDYNIVATADVNRKSRATGIVAPDDERIQLTWVSVEYCSDGSDGCATGTPATRVRLQAVSSSMGYRLHFNYGRANAVTPAQGGEWQRLDSITAINTEVEDCDPAAHSCALTRSWPTASYSGNDVTDPAGRTSQYIVSANSFIVRRAGSSSNDVTYNYDASGRITSVVRDGMTWDYAYSVSGNVATMVVDDPAGHRRTIVSDLAVGLPTAVADGRGFTTTYQYQSGRLARATAPEGNYIQLAYDSRGNVTQTQRVPKPGSGLPVITTFADYPDSCPNPRTCNRPESTTDGRGHVTEYAYADHGGVISVRGPPPATGANRPETRFTYSSLATPGGTDVRRLTGVSACQTLESCNGQADEAETVIAYAHPNLLVSAVTRRNGTASLSAQTLFGYDDVGNLTHVNGPIAGGDDMTITRYNPAREVTATISPDPDGGGPLKYRVQRITRGATTGLVARVEAGTVDTPSDTSWTSFAMLQRIDIAYDEWRRPIRTTQIGADGLLYARSQVSYDDEGLPLCTAVRMNPDEFGSLPPSACIHGSFAGFGRDRITRTLYDENHRVRTVQTGWDLTPDPENEPPEATYTYRSNGPVSSVTDAYGNRTTYIHDGHDRLRQIRYPTPTATDPPASSTTDYEQFGYDANHNVISFRNRSNRTALFVYDALDRLTRHDRYNTTNDINYAYDLLGRMLSAAQGSLSVAFEYDALGRRTREQGPLADVASQYDLAGRRTRVYYSPTLSIEHDYLETGEMSQVRIGGTPLVTYGYDDLGRRTSLTRGSGVVTSYGYGQGPWLTSIDHDPAGTAYDLTLGFTYNPAGQIVTNTRSDGSYSFTGHANGSVADTHNGLNQIVTTGGLAVDHNARGDTIELPTPGSPQGSSTEYTYSDEDRLVTAETGITLTYDPLGRLYQVGTPAGARRFAYDGLNVIGEYDAAGNHLHRYVHGPGVNEPIVWDDRSLYPVLTRRYAHADERGSVIAYSDGSDNVTHVNRYDEYGRPQDGDVAGRFGYTGQMWIPELGMHSYRARIYHQGLGRFMQPDPIGYASGMNLYAYVLNDPINLTDPSGLDLDQERDQIFCIGGNFCGPYSSYWGAAIEEKILVEVSRCDLIIFCQSFEPDEFFLQDLYRGLRMYRGGANERQSRPSIERNVDQCGGGQVIYTGTDTSIIPSGGGGAVMGTLTTGEGGLGTFRTDYWGFGLDISIGLIGGRSPSLEAFTGASISLQGGMFNIGPTISRSSSNGQWIFSFSRSFSPITGTAVSGSITESETWLTSFICPSGN